MCRDDEGLYQNGLIYFATVLDEVCVCVDVRVGVFRVVGVLECGRGGEEGGGEVWSPRTATKGRRA